jgi:hypothetical protein
VGRKGVVDHPVREYGCVDDPPLGIANLKTSKRRKPIGPGKERPLQVSKILAKVALKRDHLLALSFALGRAPKGKTEGFPRGHVI